MLVIGADALSRFVDWTDRGTCILFGDAAAAVVVQVRSLYVFGSSLVPPCFNMVVYKWAVNKTLLLWLR